MKLNQSQILEIQQISNQKDIYYRDIQAEWVDHIASEIEAELDSPAEFETLLKEKVRALPPRKFQQSVLINIHWGVVKEFFAGILHWKSLLPALFLGFGLFAGISVFGNLEIKSIEKILKTTFLILMYGTILIGFWKNKTRRNAHILATVNSIFFLSSMLVLGLQKSWFEGLGIDEASFLYCLLASICIFLVRGYTLLFQKIKKVQWR
jgi:hypothetical protein